MGCVRTCARKYEHTGTLDMQQAERNTVGAKYLNKHL